MNLFKSVDEKLAEIGFVKLEDSDSYVHYERYVADYKYTHCLDILHKYNNQHIVQSYCKGLFDEKKIGNTSVGLTYYEMNLITKKMRQKGWKSK